MKKSQSKQKESYTEGYTERQQLRTYKNEVKL